jgi:hypothetical protein
VKVRHLLLGAEEVGEDEDRAEGEDVRAIFGHRKQELEILVLVLGEVVDGEDGARIAVAWAWMVTGSPLRQLLEMGTRR